MDFKVNITDDGRVYDCTDCPYRERGIDFCGFCLKKILDDLEKIKEASELAYALAHKRR